MGTIDCYYNTGVFGPWSSLQGCFLTGQNTYFAGRLIVENGSTVATDRLGSVRGNGLQSNTIQYFPYGGEQQSGHEGVSKFGTYFRDAVGQDYAEQRYYNAGMGRFWSPDRKAGSLANPGSLNRYTYAHGDPVNLFDPHGTIVQAPDPGGPDAEDCILDPDYCEAYDAGGSGGCGGSAGAEFLDGSAPDPGGCEVPDPPPATPLPIECEADLYYRPVDIWWPKWLGATHSYGEVEEFNPNTDTFVFDIVVSGFPHNAINPNTGKPQTYINAYLNPPGAPPDPGSGQPQNVPYFETGMSAANCPGVLGALAVAMSWPVNGVPYSLTFNSNTFAHIIAGILGYPNLTGPPGAIGWYGSQ
jgi:RHS repeat-associated protein